MSRARQVRSVGHLHRDGARFTDLDRGEPEERQGGDPWPRIGELSLMTSFDRRVMLPRERGVDRPGSFDRLNATGRQSTG